MQPTPRASPSIARDQTSHGSKSPQLSVSSSEDGVKKPKIHAREHSPHEDRRHNNQPDKDLPEGMEHLDLSPAAHAKRAAGSDIPKEGLHSKKRREKFEGASQLPSFQAVPDPSNGKPEGSAGLDSQNRPSERPDPSMPGQPPPYASQITLQLDAKQIPIDHLKSEIQTLYANAYNLEEKVKKILTRQKELLEQSKTQQPSKTNDRPGKKFDDHFQLMFALHRNLIQEYYDLFRATQYASQHEDALDEVKNFCSIHSLPSRLWKHGIHNLLEWWRGRLPDSKEYLHAYIYLSYQMFTLLYETVKGFENSWMECLGDLARYRMAVEQDNSKERDLWLDIADMWYAKAAIAQPTLGRLLHHRAILARRHGACQMLSLYSRSLAAAEPFTVARSSLDVTVFKPNMSLPKFPPEPSGDPKDAGKNQADVVLSAIIRILALDFQGNSQPDPFDIAQGVLLENLASYITNAGVSYNFVGETIALSSISCLLDWANVDPASKKNGLRQVFDATADGSKMVRKYSWFAEKDGLRWLGETKMKTFRFWSLSCKVLLLHLQQLGDEAVLPYVHVSMAFLWKLAESPGFTYMIDDAFIPWIEMATFLNSWSGRRQRTLSSPRFLSDNFIHGRPQSSPQDQTSAENPPTPDYVVNEDKNMRGQVWAQGYPPDEHFAKVPSPEEEPSVGRNTYKAGDSDTRVDRCLWIGVRIAQIGDDLRLKRRSKGPWLDIKSTQSGYQFAVSSLESEPSSAPKLKPKSRSENPAISKHAEPGQVRIAGEEDVTMSG